MLSDEELAVFWKRRAESSGEPCHYDNRWQNAHAKLTRQAAFKVPDFEEARRVVEIGCGTGMITERLIELTQNGLVTGFDFPFNVTMARARNLMTPECFRDGVVPDEHVHRSVVWADVVVMATVYNFLSEANRCTVLRWFGEMRPGARVMLLDYFPTNKVPAFQHGLPYKEISLMGEVVARMGSAGFVLEETRPVTYVDSKVFHTFGVNAWSYCLTLAAEVIGGLLRLEPKYKLLIFRKEGESVLFP